jgi:hypothetical protein
MTKYRYPFRDPWPATGLANAITSVDPETLSLEWQRLRLAAPRRHSRHKQYFVGHNGMTSSGDSTNQIEPHPAIALWNYCRPGVTLPWPDGGQLRLLDYQMPLKARQQDEGIGKVDLVGFEANGRLGLIELKTHGADGRRGDTPMRAFMEGLRYSAIVDANRDDIASEVRTLVGVSLADVLPVIVLLATVSWWRAWFGLAEAGSWALALDRLACDVGITSLCLALDDPQLDPGVAGRRPSLRAKPVIRLVTLKAADPIGPPLGDRV